MALVMMRSFYSVLSKTAHFLSGCLLAAARYAAPVLMVAAALFLMRNHPETYRGGLMRGLGIAGGVVCLIGAFALSRRRLLRLSVGLVFLALAALALPGLFYFGGQTLDFARIGGAMWFGSAGMACLSLVSLLIAGALGFLGFRAMRAPGLWAAAVHLFAALLLVGAYVDFYRAKEIPITCLVGGPAYPIGEQPFSVQVESYEAKPYENAETYSLLRHDGGRWQNIGVPQREGESVRWGSESWPLSLLRPAPAEAGGSAQKYLLLPGNPPRLLLQHPAPVREYSASCKLVAPPGSSPPPAAGGEAVFRLRVNEPGSFGGWLVYLMSADASGKRVQLLLRRAPGRPFIYIGAIGLTLCSFAWAFGKKEEEVAAS